MHAARQATGFRRFDAPDEVAHWFQARLSNDDTNTNNNGAASPPSSPRTAAAAAAKAKGRGGKENVHLPSCRYFVMQDERWRTPAVRMRVCACTVF